MKSFKVIQQKTHYYINLVYNYVHVWRPQLQINHGRT